jgi:hypothetical protein
MMTYVTVPFPFPVTPGCHAQGGNASPCAIGSIIKIFGAAQSMGTPEPLCAAAQRLGALVGFPGARFVSSFLPKARPPSVVNRVARRSSSGISYLFLALPLGISHTQKRAPLQTRGPSRWRIKQWGHDCPHRRESEAVGYGRKNGIAETMVEGSCTDQGGKPLSFFWYEVA